MTEPLAPAELNTALAELPGVHRGSPGRLQIRVQAPTFAAAIELVERVGAAAEQMNHHPDIDVRWTSVTFGLSTHAVRGVTTLDLELARRILAAASELEARLLPVAGRVDIALDAVDAEAIRPFWRVGLGYVEQVTDEGNVELQHPDGQGPVLWFQPMDPPRAGRSRFHLDVYVPAEQAQARVKEVVAAGGTLVTDEFAPDWWVLADAEGNELCVCVG